MKSKHPHLPGTPLTPRVALSAMLALTVTMSISRGSQARPGTHAAAVSTWDTRASTVSFGGLYGVVDGGHFHNASYYANFTNTTGILSSQFGIHYVGLSEGETSPTLHGVSGTATALFNIPLNGRYENGVPGLGLGLYLGGAPTVLISAEENYLSAPVVLGVGLNWSPVSFVTITPWVEGSLSLDFDTRFRELEASGYEDINDFVTIENPDGTPVDPQDPTSFDDVTIRLTEQNARNVVAEAVELELGVHASARLGLAIGVHLDKRVDLNFNLAYSTVDAGFSGAGAIQFGGNLIVRWDSIVPAVLPEERRFDDASCEAVTARFRQCHQSFDWIRPEHAGAAKSCLIERQKRRHQQRSRSKQASPEGKQARPGSNQSRPGKAGTSAPPPARPAPPEPGGPEAPERAAPEGEGEPAVPEGKSSPAPDAEPTPTAPSGSSRRFPDP